MKLSFEQIKSIALGFAYAEEKDGAVKLHRLTQEQEAWYEKTNADYHERGRTPAGIKLSFETNSENLFIKVLTTPATGRRFFSIDVFVDGKMSGSLINFEGMEIPDNYSGLAGVFVPPCGEVSKNFSLGKGKKHVCIHLPWSVWTDILDLSLDDGSYITPIKPEKKLLAYGDSITHGYDALYPSNRYIARLADALGAEEFNKAVGGERFSPGFAALADDISPDYITVAYGTNDWSCKQKDDFESDCKGFFSNISVNYPDAKIFAITPIWRNDIDEDYNGWIFSEVEETIRNVAAEFRNITVISGFGFVPEDLDYFGDRRLHPNDEGFKHYFNSLYAEMKKYI